MSDKDTGRENPLARQARGDGAPRSGSRGRFRPAADDAY